MDKYPSSFTEHIGTSSKPAERVIHIALRNKGPFAIFYFDVWHRLMYNSTIEINGTHFLVMLQSLTQTLTVNRPLEVLSNVWSNLWNNDILLLRWNINS